MKTCLIGLAWIPRRRSVVAVRRNPAGETLDKVRIDNDPVALAADVVRPIRNPKMILEAINGWCREVDALKECGATVHLSHPLGNNWGNQRVNRATSEIRPIWSTSWEWGDWRGPDSHRRSKSGTSGFTGLIVASNDKLGLPA